MRPTGPEVALARQMRRPTGPRIHQSDSAQKPTINFATGAVMIVVAIVIDFVVKPFLAGGLLDFIVDIPATIVFFAWFWLCGARFTGFRVLGFGATTVAEALPVVDIAPWWTITIAYNVRREWKPAKET